MDFIPDLEDAVATDRKQLNVRLDGDSRERLERLGPVVTQHLGIIVSQADLIRLALIALEEKHAPKPAKKGAKS